MSRIHLRASLLLATCLGLATVAPGLAQDSATAMKIAVVNLDRVIFLSPLGKSMQDDLKLLEESIKNELQNLATKAQEVRLKLSANRKSRSRAVMALFWVVSPSAAEKL